LNREIGIILAALIAFMAFASWLYLTWPAQGSSGFEVILASNGQVLISDQDVSVYNATSHEFNLTAGCVDRMKGMELYHKSVEVRLDGRLLGNGSLWASFDSMPPPAGLSLMDIYGIQHGFSTTIWMEACYPYGYYPNCTVPAFFGDLAAHFQGLGKLVG
jgi:hypothetical protein